MDLSKLKELRNQRFSLTCPTTHAITKKSEVFKLEGIIVNSYNNNYNNRINTYYSNFLIYGNRIAKSCNDVMEETHRNLEKKQYIDNGTIRKFKIQCWFQNACVFKFIELVTRWILITVVYQPAGDEVIKKIAPNVIGILSDEKIPNHINLIRTIHNDQTQWTSCFVFC